MKCLICKGTSEKFCDMDFSHSNVQLRQKDFNKDVDFYLCSLCEFCFCPEIMAWTPSMFAKHIYNKDYHKIDPGFKEVRAINNSQVLLSNYLKPPKHLDYGGGARGLLSSILKKNGWDSKTLDPFGKNSFIGRDEKFKLITSFEVFEHTTDPVPMVKYLEGLLAPGGTILFSTEVHDDVLQRGWWYLNPRSGHIALYSSLTLDVLGSMHKMTYKQLTRSSHIYEKLT